MLKQIRAMGRASMDANYGSSPAGVKETRHTVAMRDGHESLIIVYAPDKAVEGGSPLIQLNFGGGYVMVSECA